MKAGRGNAETFTLAQEGETRAPLPSCLDSEWQPGDLLSTRRVCLGELGGREAAPGSVEPLPRLTQNDLNRPSKAVVGWGRNHRSPEQVRRDQKRACNSEARGSESKPRVWESRIDLMIEVMGL